MADNGTIGHVQTLMCPKPAAEIPPGTPEMRAWDGVQRGSPAEEYLKSARGGLDAVRGDSFHYQQSANTTDALIGEVIGAGVGHVLKLGARLLGAAKGLAKAPPVKPPTASPAPVAPPAPPAPATAAGGKSAAGNAADGVVIKGGGSKAAFGERAAHDKMVKKGHEPVGKTDGNYVEGHKGIDGVYKNANPPPDYIITEVKAGDAKLAKGLADGTNQMDDAWVNKRLVDKVGIDEAAKIEAAMKNGTVDKWLVRVAEDGSSSARLIDSAGNAIPGNAGKVAGF